MVYATEYSGTLHCKGCIIVPCQCYLNNQDNLKQNSLKCENRNTSGIGDNNSKQTEYFEDKSFELTNNKTDVLWKKQFSRWWSWNWQRKRKALLCKFGIKSNEKTCPYDRNGNCPLKTSQDKSCECKLPLLKSEKNINTHEKELRNIHYERSITSAGKLHQPIFTSNDYSPVEQFMTVPPVCSSSLPEPSKGRRKRNKHKERLYEGWMREVRSSDSENSDSEITVKEKSKKQSNKEKMHYLTLRLRRFKSDNVFINNNKKKVDTKGEKEDLSTTNSEKLVASENNEKLIDNKVKNNTYISPISGKLYDLRLIKTSLPLNDSYPVEQLNSVQNTDKNFISKQEYKTFLNYTSLKYEHTQLLKSIDYILNKTKFDNNNNIFENRNTNKISSSESDKNKPPENIVNKTDINNEKNAENKKSSEHLVYEFDNKISLSENVEENVLKKETYENNKETNENKNENLKSVCKSLSRIKISDLFETISCQDTSEESKEEISDVNLSKTSSYYNLTKFESNIESVVEANKVINISNIDEKNTSSCQKTIETSIFKDIKLSEIKNNNIKSLEQIKNKVPYVCLTKSLPGCIFFDPTLMKFCNGYNLNIPKSNNLILNSKVDVKENNNETETFTTKNTENTCYDINYIHNNLDSFRSSISDTEFIVSYLENSKL